MFYTYLTFNDGKYDFGVCSHLLLKKLPLGLCYFEAFSNKSEAKNRETYLKKLSFKRISSLISGKKSLGFICQSEGEKTVISLKNGVYNLTEPILVKGQNITIRGGERTVIEGTEKIDGWVNEGNGVFSASVKYDADALYINDEKYQMARFPKYNPNIRIFGGFSRDVLSKAKADTWKK